MDNSTTDPTADPAPAASSATSPRDVVLITFGAVGPVAAFLTGLKFISCLAASDSGLPLLLTWQYLLNILPWVPVAVAVGLVQKPRLARPLPWIAFVSISACLLLKSPHTPLGDTNGLLAIITWVSFIFSLLWTHGIAALAMSLWLIARIGKGLPTPIPSRPTSTSRDIGPILWASLGPAMCWILPSLVIDSAILPTWAYGEGIIWQINEVIATAFPWGFAAIAILRSRRPGVCRNLPFVTLATMGILILGTLLVRLPTVCVGRFGIDILARANDSLRSLPIPAFALILWARRRAKTLAPVPRFYSPGVIITVIVTLIGPAIVGGLMFWLDEETSWLHDFLPSLLWGFAFICLLLIAIPIIASVCRTRRHLSSIFLTSAAVNAGALLVVPIVTFLVGGWDDALFMALVATGGATVAIAIAGLLTSRPTEDPD
jgi:hypothetical protein